MTERERALSAARPFLRSVEPLAMRYCREPDWEHVEPRITLCTTKEHRDVFSYFRYAVSSEPQKPGSSSGRCLEFLVTDKNSGAMLGLCGLKN